MLFGVSLRLVDGPEHAEWLRARAPQAGRAAGLAVLAIVLLPILTSFVGPVWPRMAANALVLLPPALLLLRPGWRELLAPSPQRFAVGVGAAAVLYALGAGVVSLVSGLPSIARQMATVYGWRTAVDPRAVLPLLLLVIAGEEIVWRNAITLPLAGRLGAWPGVLVAGVGFALAHVSMGVPLLVLAALGAGTFWSALVVKTRSAIPSFVSHVLWDVSVLLVFPYVRS